MLTDHVIKERLRAMGDAIVRKGSVRSLEGTRSRGVLHACRKDFTGTAMKHLRQVGK